MLKVNNIDVDTLYEKGCVEMEKKLNDREELNE